MNDWEVEMLEPHNRSLKKLEKKVPWSLALCLVDPILFCQENIRHFKFWDAKTQDEKAYVWVLGYLGVLAKYSVVVALWPRG